MHPQLQAALGRLDDATRELRTAVEGLPAAARAQRPAADRWSTNEVLEHVAKVERFFLTGLLGNLEKARTAGLAAEVAEPAILPDELRRVVEDRSTRRMAPEPVQPTGQVEAGAALDDIEAGHARFRDALQQAEGQALSAVSHDHRVFGPLNVYQWVDLIASHERRHLAQVREIAAQLAQQP